MGILRWIEWWSSLSLWEWWQSFSEHAAPAVATIQHRVGRAVVDWLDTVATVLPWWVSYAVVSTSYSPFRTHSRPHRRRKTNCTVSSTMTKRMQCCLLYQQWYYNRHSPSSWLSPSLSSLHRQSVVPPIPSTMQRKKNSGRKRE